MDTLLYLLAFIFDNKKLHLENKKIFQVKSSQQIYVIGNIHGCKDLLERIKAFKKVYPETKEVPRPDNWSGWILEPTRIEFWLKGPNRIHERLRYSKESNNWIKNLLNP